MQKVKKIHRQFIHWKNEVIYILHVLIIDNIFN